MRLLFCTFLFAALGAAAEPNLTLIDGPGNVGQYSSIDFVGNATRVSYYDADNGDLKLATCMDLCDRAGATWTTTTVDSAGDVGLYTSLGSIGGVPAIAYFDATNKALKLAVCSANCTSASPTWVITTVDRGSGDTGRNPSLLGGDNPRIAYYDRANGDLKLATCTAACTTANAAWTITTVDSAGDVGRSPVLRGDFTGALVIAYADGSNGQLKTAICPSSCGGVSPPWIFHVVDRLSTNLETHISLALNEGAPSISYFDAADGVLKLATCNTSCGTSSPEWVTSTIDRVGDAGEWSALVLNGHIPGIAYFASIRSCNGSVCHEVDELRFAVCFPQPGHATSDMNCVISTIDNSGRAGVDPAIRRGGDSVWITYYDAAGADLKVAYAHMDEVLALPQNYTSLWWDSEESGWGINFSHQGDIVFATLFTYDSSGAPMWLVMSAGREQARNVFSGELYRTTGPPFNAQPFNPIGPGNFTTVGTMNVGFAGDSAWLTYTVNGVTVNKTLRKQLFNTARAGRCQNVASRAGTQGSFQDLWWNPNESGWGLNIAQQGDIIFATLFTYDANGRGIWYVMSGGRRQSDGSFVGELYRTTGPAFDAAPFQPITTAQITTVGMMTLRFSDLENGTLVYSVNGTTVSKAITRQVFATPVPLCG
jgi:hypothetical protein